jgi:hypothetical protein
MRLTQLLQLGQWAIFVRTDFLFSLFQIKTFLFFVAAELYITKSSNRARPKDSLVWQLLSASPTENLDVTLNVSLDASQGELFAHFYAYQGNYSSNDAVYLLSELTQFMLPVGVQGSRNLLSSECDGDDRHCIKKPLPKKQKTKHWKSELVFDMVSFQLKIYNPFSIFIFGYQGSPQRSHKHFKCAC